LLTELTFVDEDFGVARFLSAFSLSSSSMFSRSISVISVWQRRCSSYSTHTRLDIINGPPSAK